jgi:hypothetical protein
MVKYFPQLERAFTAMRIVFKDGRIALSSEELTEALAESLPLGRGDDYFALTSKLASTCLALPAHLYVCRSSQHTMSRARALSVPSAFQQGAAAHACLHGTG